MASLGMSDGNSSRSMSAIPLIFIWLGFCLFAPIGAAIGNYDRGRSIGPPNLNENDDRGGGWSASVRFISTSKLERANPDKVQKSSDMVCFKFPNSIFSWDFSRFDISIWSEMFEGDKVDRAPVIGLIWQGFATVGLETDQPDRDRVNSSWSADRGAIGQIKTNKSYLRVEWWKSRRCRCKNVAYKNQEHCDALASGSARIHSNPMTSTMVTRCLM